MGSGTPETHAAGVERELLKCKRRKADGADVALLAVVPAVLQDVPTEADSEPDPEEPTPPAKTSRTRTVALSRAQRPRVGPLR